MLPHGRQEYNTMNAIHVLYFLDVTRPVISGCPFSASGTLLPGATAVEVTWTPPTQMDNSGISSLTSSHAPDTMFPAGETEVTYTAIDTPGNTAQCSFIVTVTLLSGEYHYS